MDSTIQIIGKLMDVSALRQKVLANNLANTTTPGFKRQDIQFHEVFKDAIDADSSMKIDQIDPKIEMDKTQPSRPDGNTVNMQDELAAMMENSVLYKLSSKIIDNKYTRLRSAIKGK